MRSLSCTHLTSSPSDFAGATNVFSETCSGTCYTDYVIKDPSLYDTAYFEVDYVKVFSASGTNTIVSEDAADRAWVSRAAALVGAGAAVMMVL